MKRVLLAGGSGFLGHHLAQHLAAEGLEPWILSRTPEKLKLSHGQPCAWRDLTAHVESMDAIVNLAGEGIADQRWTPARKQQLRASRLEPTQRLAEAIRQAQQLPQVLIQLSAIGIYGHPEASCTEASAAGTGFLAELCQAWEAASEPLPIRRVCLRLGVVLAKDGGALPRMALPVRLFAGSPLGRGSQPISWIHVEDVCRMIVQALRDHGWQGTYNAVAPQPITNAGLMRLLARTLHRPLWPTGLLAGALLKLALGEMAEEMLLCGAAVRPERALAQGFCFQFEEAKAAVGASLA